MANVNGLCIAVVGATGNVGHEMLQTLEAREFPAEEIFAVASDSSIGKEVSYGEDKLLKVHGITSFDFSKVDIALFSAGKKVAAEYAPKAAAAGCIVIDNSSEFRMNATVPLVVPEVNPDALDGFRDSNIIANPNCSTIQMVAALKPLHDISPIKRVVVSTYQAVSGAGRAAMDELFAQTRHVYMNQPLVKEEFTKQIAFNVIPHIDDFLENGYTREEQKMREETQKLLGPDVQVVATCVRVPVFVGHSLSINVEFDNAVTLEQAREAWAESESISIVDHPIDGGYVTPEEVAGDDFVYISRSREDSTVPYGLSFWCVADNLRKGAALNAVQIAEALVDGHL